MILDRFRLDGKVAIVTGAGRGIGRACAMGLAEAGAHVVCAARTQEQIDEVADDIRALGPKALSSLVSCDPQNGQATADVRRATVATVRSRWRLPRSSARVPSASFRSRGISIFCCEARKKPSRFASRTTFP